MKKFSPEFIELMRAFEERAWLRGDEHARRMAYLIWGPQAVSKPQLARKLLEQALNPMKLPPKRADLGTVARGVCT